MFNLRIEEVIKNVVVKIDVVFVSSEIQKEGREVLLWRFNVLAETMTYCLSIRLEI